MIRTLLLAASGGETTGRISKVDSFSLGASIESSHTIVGCQFGAPEVGRVIVVCLAFTGTEPSVTIGGVPTTVSGGAIFSATVPSGTSGDVVITYDAEGTLYCEGVVLRVVDLSSHVPMFGDVSTYSSSLVAQVSTFRLENVPVPIGTTYNVWINGILRTYTSFPGISHISTLNGLVSRVNSKDYTPNFSGLLRATRTSYNMIISSEIPGTPFTLESEVSDPSIVQRVTTPTASENGPFGDTPVRGIVRAPSLGVVIGCSHGSIGGVPRISVAFDEIIGEGLGMDIGRSVIPYSTTADEAGIEWGGITRFSDTAVLHSEAVAGFRTNVVATFQ